MAIQIMSVLALIASLTGNTMINLKKKAGFIVWIASNVMWIVVNLMGTPNIPQIAMFMEVVLMVEEVVIVLSFEGAEVWSRSVCPLRLAHNIAHKSELSNRLGVFLEIWKIFRIAVEAVFNAFCHGTGDKKAVHSGRLSGEEPYSSLIILRSSALPFLRS